MKKNFFAGYMGILTAVVTATGAHAQLAFTNVRSVLAATDRKAFAIGIKRTAMLHLQFGVMLALGIILAAISRPIAWLQNSR